MLQLITSDELTTINLNSATVVHNDDELIKVIINSDALSELQKEMIENQEGFYFSFDSSQDCVKTKDHYINTSIADGGSLSSLEESQWLIEFALPGLMSVKKCIVN